MARLTAKGVEATRASAVRREIGDDYMRGLYLLVHPTGNKSWAVRYRQGNKSHKHTVGPYPAFDLKQARDAAAGVLRAVAEGRSPKQLAAGTLGEAAERYLRMCEKSQKSAKNTGWLLRRYVLAGLSGRRLGDITRGDIRTLLAGIDKPIAANRVHSVTRRFFNWAVENDLIAHSPVDGIRTPNKEISRDRVLTDDELRQVWHAANASPAFAGIVKVLILTGQRRSEVSRMEWSELDLDAGVWTLPKERTKNARLHQVPLSRQAVGIIKGLPRIGGRFVFTVNGQKPFNGFTAKEGFCADLPRWTLHDLRRTAASGMARLGVSLVVIEKVLNHVSGSLAGIVGVYQRHEFADEKRAALQLWTDHVERLVR